MHLIDNSLRKTNADPSSSAAMELTPFKTRTTSYGFDTLAELPHTNLKESLFHSDLGPSHLRALSIRDSQKSASTRKALGKKADCPSIYIDDWESSPCSSPGIPMNADYCFLQVPDREIKDNLQGIQYFCKPLTSFEDSDMSPPSEEVDGDQSEGCDDDIDYLEMCAASQKQTQDQQDNKQVFPC